MSGVFIYRGRFPDFLNNKHFTYASEKFGWLYSRTDQMLKPVIESLNTKKEVFNLLLHCIMSSYMQATKKMFLIFNLINSNI